MSPEDVLESLRAEPDVIGCAVVTRDGLPALVKFNGPHDPHTLSAMAAAALAAAETALLGLDSGGIQRMVLQGGSTHTIIEGMDRTSLLVVVAKQSIPMDELVSLATKALQDLQATHAR